jgi:hypothetical protein
LLYDIGLGLVSHIHGARESCVSDLQQVNRARPRAHLCHSLVTTLNTVILSR